MFHDEPLSAAPGGSSPQINQASELPPLQTHNPNPDSPIPAHTYSPSTKLSPSSIAGKRARCSASAAALIVVVTLVLVVQRYNAAKTETYPPNATAQRNGIETGAPGNGRGE